MTSPAVCESFGGLFWFRSKIPAKTHGQVFLRLFSVSEALQHQLCVRVSVLHLLPGGEYLQVELGRQLIGRTDHPPGRQRRHLLPEGALR